MTDLLCIGQFDLRPAARQKGSKEIISMSIVLELDRRMLEPRAWRSKVISRKS